MRGRRRGTAGFTLIEVVVVIAVVSILAAMAVPYAVKIIDQSREEATKKEMEDLHNAIIGDPKSPPTGSSGTLAGFRPTSRSSIRGPRVPYRLHRGSPGEGSSA